MNKFNDKKILSQAQSIQLNQLIDRANKVYDENFDKTAWFGRCIFLSWYCDVGTCKFCFRSTQKDRIKFAEHAKRTPSSILTEAILAKNLGWRIEFLTGGYKIYPLDELVELARLVSIAYGEKIWLNLGTLKKEELLRFKPYIKGIVASIETINEELHNQICPDKAIRPYEDMFETIENTPELKDLQKSMTIVIGLGEKKEHFEKLEQFIKKYKLNRITFYALKPIKGTPYTEGPETEDYVWWIAKTRIAFPKIQIMAGTAANRIDEIDIIMKAGANALTKFPATKLFGTEKAKLVEKNIAKSGRVFKGTLTRLPDIDWYAEIDKLDISDKLKEQTKERMDSYLKMMRTNKNKKINQADLDE